ncbi:hypothetical protein Cob_v004199 [Colletotrichum orbiculare MAFF 240422]|uniref:Uncharacterized protein n=1 Tax=Colletotrichum orbiculare (strain 104-T / ATCC 96160 / CBS 514.97 / LARS 414 / MAFF 240422) TaxID=1213857 RepID=A0A484FXH1_COLOR|nr:hypothetical protein Cob_v004199 [Colletotrichum orbiculare MAFF 240422]
MLDTSVVSQFAESRQPFKDHPFSRAPGRGPDDQSPYLIINIQVYPVAETISTLYGSFTFRLHKEGVSREGTQGKRLCSDCLGERTRAYTTRVWLSSCAEMKMPGLTHEQLPDDALDAQVWAGRIVFERCC